MKKIMLNFAFQHTLIDLKIDMISKNKIKYIHSLELKKMRKREGAFVAEGTKLVGDLLATGMKPAFLACTDDWTTTTEYSRLMGDGLSADIVTPAELQKASFLQHPQQVLAVFPLPDDCRLPSASALENDLILALDGVQDPGNMGTIIRIADWFGIKTIVCSRETVDAFSPKAVQATMGSIARVNVVYTDLCEYLSQLPASIPVYGTLLDGENIYSKQLTSNGIIIMGNEGNGISEEARKHINQRLLIPSYPANSPTAESLNVSIATAITVAEFRRVTS